MSDELFYDPAVLRAIRAVLVSRGIRAKHDLQDAIGDVVVEAIAHVRETGHPPADVAEAIPLARSIANNHGVDEARKRVSRGRANLGPTGSPDDHAAFEESAADKLARARALAVLREVLSKDQLEVFADVGAGVEQKELAAERGTSAAAMRQRMRKSRKTAIEALRAHGYWVAGGVAALLATGVAVYVGSLDSGVVTHAPSSRELAELERRDASEACREQKWDACERALDRAAKLDGEGDRAAEVLQMRAAIAAGRRDAGPGGGGD